MRPKNAMIGAACAVAVGLAAVAGLSWAVAGQLAPATYAARATIAADARGGNPGADQLAEWQRYHESLLKDPALTDLAAERMGRKGIISLSTPGALGMRLNADLSTQSPAPGQLTLELRGPGSTETGRILDTFVTAMVSQANADRERRSDGLGTGITEVAAAGPAPIEDSRLLYAGIIFIVGGGGCLGGAVFALRRINSIKARFDRQHLDDTSPSEWDRPPETFARG
jgi:hypothetical protein